MLEGKLLKKLWADVKPGRKFLILGACFYVPVTLFSVMQPLLIGYGVQLGMINQSPSWVLKFSLFFLSAVVLLGCFEYAQGICLQIAGQKLVMNIRQKAFAKVQRLKMGFLDKTPVGQILTRLTNDAESVAEMFSLGAVQIVGDILFLLGTFFMLLYVNIHLTLYSFIVMPLLAFGLYFFRLWTRKAFVKVRSVLSSLNSFLQEYLSGMPTVQMANRISHTHQIFDAHNDDYLRANRRAVFLDAAIYSFVDAISYLAVAAVLWGGFHLKSDNALQLGILVAFIEALSRFFQPLRELSNRYAVFQSALVSLERIYKLHDWPEEIDNKVEYDVNFKRDIRFLQVNFSYNDAEKVLHDVSFTINKGERVALVGRTGSGKSTVIKLLNRFYDISSGQITIDDKKIHEFSLGEIRKLISVVPQDVFLFNASLAENLRFGNTHASDEQLWDALKVVQLKDKIRKKGGLNMMVKTKGKNFSLGERQLLSLARALVTDPPILVLDEATASVDSRTERLLQVATKKLLAKRTALIIAHRLSTIQDADKILVFSNGRIVEQGGHNELLKKQGQYSELIKAQAQKNKYLQ